MQVRLRICLAESVCPHQENEVAELKGPARAADALIVRQSEFLSPGSPDLPTYGDLVCCGLLLQN